MAFSSITRAFAALLFILAIAMLAPLGIALFDGERNAGIFLIALALTVFSAAGSLALSIGPRHPSGFRGAMAVVLLLWVVAPAYAAFPFMAEGMRYGDAYFEAVSAITTTGGWLSHEGAVASRAGMLWRAILQWLGGLASLAIAAAIFIRPAFIGIDTLLPPFSRGERDSFLRPLRNAAVSFSGVYFAVSLIAFMVMSFAGAPVFDAIILAMTTVASGGFIPAADGVSAYPIGVVASIFLFTLLGGINFILIARLFQPRGQRFRDVETSAFLLIVVWASVLLWLSAGAGDLDLLPAQAFNAVSLMTTNGYLIGETPPLTVALVIAIIGAAAVSTAGGFKILRWIVIMQRAREEVRRLIIPNSVTGPRRVANELGVWMHFLVFTLTLSGLMLAISLGGHPFDLAAAAATAALSNAGPLISLAEHGADGYAVFQEPLRWLLLAGMILGRLEAAVALALINRAFWRW